MEVVTITEARQRIQAVLKFHSPQAEWVDPQAAIGRIAAEDIVALQPYPPYRKSPFDGYALNVSKGNTYKLLATIGAGIIYQQPVPPGCAVRLMTGCAVPEGCDTVIPQEYVYCSGDTAVIQTPIVPGSNIIPIGEECAQGTTVIPQGASLTPGALSVAIGLGNTRIHVYKRASVLFLTTGQELIMPGEQRKAGQIYNSNAFLFKPLLDAYGADVTFCHLSDKPENQDSNYAAMQTLAAGKDLIVSTGGVSVGLFDSMPQLYHRLGARQLYNRIAMRPGSASYGGLITHQAGITLVLGLSGNPSAAFNAFHLLAIPALRRINGENNFDFPRFTCTLTDDIKKENPVDRFVQGKLSFIQGKPYFTPNTTLTSSALLGIAHTNALAIIKKGAAPLKSGDSLSALYLA